MAFQSTDQDVDLFQRIASIEETQQKSLIERNLLIQKALSSSNVDEIFKAQRYIAKLSGQNVEQSKTMLLDPMAINLGLGYQDKPLNVSLSMLRNMGKVPVIKAIIGTRIDQVCNFIQPQQDKYSTGFIIKPKKAIRTGEGELKISKEEQTIIDRITEFVLNCGDPNSVDKYRHESFETFTRKFIKDSLELDQACSEQVNTVGGDLFSCQVVDGATIRIADTYFLQLDEEYKRKRSSDLVDGYLPFYVQIYMNRIHNEYFPWELSMGVRNPESNIYSNGYGRSELEDLVQTVTNILNADSYNANYFKVGSNPKGILRVTGNVNQSRLEDFRNQWQSQMAGVRNAHKLPIIEAEKMDFINTQSSNKDMEYSRYYEFLIKIGCAVYKIDPAEINFPLSGGSEQKAMFEGNNEARLKHSRDKGLKPLLRFYQAYIQKNIIERLNPDYEFQFKGLEIEDQKEELSDDVQKIQNFMTVNEIRRKHGLKDIKPEQGGDSILNPMLMSMIQQQQMMQQQGGDQSNQYVDEEYSRQDEEENPFTKALAKDIEKIFKQ